MFGAGPAPFLSAPAFLTYCCILPSLPSERKVRLIQVASFGM